MQLYRVTRYFGDVAKYAATFADTKPLATREAHRRDITLGRVELLTATLDKAMVVQILNGGDLVGTRLRTWKVTARGGLQEIGV